MSEPQIFAWGKKPGAWALEAEEHEEELNQQREAMEAASKAASKSVVVPEAEFPSLTAAVATKGKKKKAQKITVSLAEFNTYSVKKESGLSHEELMNLPTGPRERTAEEMERTRFGDRDGRSWRGGGGDRDRGMIDEGRRSRGVSREPLGPSRADELDDWNVGKKSVVASSGGGFERRGRSDWSGAGKADELDSWVTGKKSLGPVESGRRYGGLGINGGADADTWGRKREARVENNGSSEGRPKLNLKPRSVPLSNDRTQAQAQAQSADVLVVKPESPDVAVVKKSSNPFGAARPREEVLAEKGQDWKKIDEQFDSLKIKERPGSSDSRPGSAGGRGFRRGNSGEEKTERSWRKPESVESSRPTSAAGNPTEENGNAEQK